MKVLVVGAGLSGSSAARVLADAGHQVQVIDSRDHLGGNVYDKKSETGFYVHAYGPHIFHTNSDKVMSFLERFASWVPYKHRVEAQHQGDFYPIPVNLETIRKIDSSVITQSDAEQWLKDETKAFTDVVPANSEDSAYKLVGKRLTEMFFRGYTRKQWNRDLSELDPSVVSRIPVKTSDDPYYFSDRYEALPYDGYTSLVSNMLAHDSIQVSLSTWYDNSASSDYDHVVFTGCIDKFFGLCYGELPYRHLSFDHRIVSEGTFPAKAATINFSDTSTPATRVTNFRRLQPWLSLNHDQSDLVYETSSDNAVLCYPILTDDSKALYLKYRALADATKNTTFIGRLAEFRYYNMDQAVASSIAKATKLTQTWSA